MEDTVRKSKDVQKMDIEEWQIVPDTHEAIIDRDTWELVQKIRQRKRRNVRHNYQIPILLGHLFCADCGSKLYYVKPPKQVKYYCCAGDRKKSETTEQTVISDLGEIYIPRVSSLLSGILKQRSGFSPIKQLQ